MLPKISAKDSEASFKHRSISGPAFKGILHTNKHTDTHTEHKLFKTMFSLNNYTICNAFVVLVQPSIELSDIKKVQKKLLADIWYSIFPPTK